MIPRPYRLPLLFAVVALACVALVGMVSFEGALGATTRSQTAMLESLAHHIVDDTRLATWLGDKARIVRMLSPHTLNTFLIAIRDDQGRIVAATPDHNTTLNTILPLPHAPGSSQARRHMFASDEPVFAVLDIPGTNHTVTVAYTPPRNSPVLYAQTLLAPLLISSIVVVWLAIWVGIAFTQYLTKLDRQRLELERLALHDPLTNLPNRSLFNDRLARAMEQAQRDKLPLAVGILDLDGFKTVNDILGHERGDRLLIDLSQRAKKMIRARDTFARLGGDEFALIMPATGIDNAQQVAQRVIESIAEELPSDHGTLHITASIGIAVHPRDATDADGLVRQADQAMYEAKRSRAGIAFAA